MTTPDLPAPVKPPKRRYWPDEAFPPYRYVPLGQHPHPTMDRGGHMREGRPEVPKDPPSELAWMTNRWWLYGVDLFNNWYFWEATETWEPLWRGLDRQRPEALFIQALMMCAGGMLKIQCREFEGTSAFWKEAHARFTRVEGYAPELWGLKTKKTHRAFAAFFRSVEKTGTLPALDKRVPQLLLPM